jgi:hypothetical protein
VTALTCGTGRSVVGGKGRGSGLLNHRTRPAQEEEGKKARAWAGSAGTAAGRLGRLGRKEGEEKKFSFSYLIFQIQFQLFFNLF